MAVEIFMQKVVTGNGLRFDLSGKNLPGNFLGMAANLKFEGLKVEDYQKMEFGNAFGAFKNEELPIKMIKNDLGNGQLIFGITLKADSLTPMKDGVIGSFFFNGAADGKFVGFENQVLSQYENGRVDLKDVKWLSGLDKKLPVEVIGSVSAEVADERSVVGPLAAAAPKSVELPRKLQSVIEKMSSKEMILENVGDLSESYQSDLSPEAVVRAEEIELKPQSAGLDDSFFWYSGIALLGVVILMAAAWFYVKQKRFVIKNAMNGVKIRAEGGFA